jgi:hypothetical protein
VPHVLQSHFAEARPATVTPTVVRNFLDPLPRQRGPQPWDDVHIHGYGGPRLTNRRFTIPDLPGRAASLILGFGAKNLQDMQDFKLTGPLFKQVMEALSDEERPSSLQPVEGAHPSSTSISSTVPVNCDLAMLPLLLNPDTFSEAWHNDPGNNGSRFSHVKVLQCLDTTILLTSFHTGVLCGVRRMLRFTNPGSQVSIPSNTKIHSKPIQGSSGLKVVLTTKHLESAARQQRGDSHRASDLGWSLCISSVENSHTAFLLVPDVRINTGTAVASMAQKYILAYVRHILVKLYPQLLYAVNVE